MSKWFKASKKWCISRR